MKIYKNFIIAGLLAVMLVTPAYASEQATNYSTIKLANIYRQTLSEVDGIASTDNELDAATKAVMCTVIDSKFTAMAKAIKEEETRQLTTEKAVEAKALDAMNKAKADMDTYAALVKQCPALQGTLDEKTKIYNQAKANYDKAVADTTYAQNTFNTFNQAVINELKAKGASDPDAVNFASQGTPASIAILSN